MTTDDGTQSKRANRDEHGRFLPGHGLPGPGNPRIRHAAELQAAVREAGTPDRLRELLDVLHARGMKGDVHAARLWIERVAGKPREATGDALPVSVDLSTVEACRESAARVTQAAASGDIDSDHAAKLLTMVGVVVNTHEVAAIDERLAALEQQQQEDNPNRRLPHAS